MNPNDDSKYQDVINTLRQLQQVKAPKGFEADLMRRIHSEDTTVTKFSWQNIFIPSRLIPTAALAVTALLLIFILDHSGISQDNPLMTTPRERQDVTVTAKTDNAAPERKALKNEEFSAQQEISGLQKDKDKIAVTEPSAETTHDRQRTIPPVMRRPEGSTNRSGRFITANITSDRINNYPVNKAGLNFRQINLSNEQKMRLDQLKERMELMFKTKEKQ